MPQAWRLNCPVTNFRRTPGFNKVLACGRHHT
nr:MAG TPA_asm: hypothetical protein [Caudoviricetes sp.]